MGQRRIFYGWYIVGAAVIAQMVAIGIQAYSPGVFLKPMAAELGWSREDYANAQTVGTFVMGVAGIFIGGLIDRRGARPLMIGGALISGVCLMLLSRVQTLTGFYLLRGVGFMIGSVGFGNLVVNVTVAKWFVRHRGMAVSLASAGVSLGGVLITPLAQILVNQIGWRDTWTVLGVAIWVTIIPTAFVMRRTPEDYGLLPDGDQSTATAQRGANRRSATPMRDDSWTRPEAIRTVTIWLLILAFGIANVGLGSMLFHMIPFLTDSGFSSGTAAFMFSTVSWSALISKPLWGVLMARVHARYLSAFTFAVAAVSVCGLLVTADRHAEWLSVVALVCWGLSIGGTIPLQETIWASYFGRLHLGTIRAVAMPFTIIFSAFGPKFAARLYDQSGSYTSSFLMFAGFWVAGLVLVLLARTPRRTAPARQAVPAPVEPA